MTTGGWPLEGRQADLDATVRALDGDHHVAILGVAGLGKTRLAEAVADALVARGGAVRRVVATPGDVSFRLAPFLGLLDGRLDDPLAAVLDALAAPTGTPRDAASSVLVVDDAHNLDPTSAGLVQQLAVHRPPVGGSSLRLLLLARIGVELPDAVAAVLADGHTTILTPGPLDDAAARRAVAARLGGRLEPHSADRIVGVAHGNPLYLREIVEGALATGALVEEAGLWRLRGELTVTPVLEDVVLARLLSLPGDELDAVELVAVAGELDLAVLGRLVTPARLERLERGAHLRVRRVAGRTVVDVGHPLVRELLRARLPALGSLRLCRSLAEATQGALADGTLPERGEARVQMAAWYLNGGVTPPADELLAAATTATELGDTGLGARLALAACEARPDARSALVAAWCLGQRGAHAEAIELVQRFRPLVEDPWERAAMDLRVAEEHWWGDQDRGRALAALHAGLDGTGDEGALLQAQLGVFAVLDGRITEAEVVGRRYVGHRRAWVRFIAGLALAQSLAYADRGAEAAEIAGELHRALQDERADLLGDVDLHVVGLQLGLLYDGRLAEAVSLAELVDGAARSRPDRQARAWGAVLRGSSALVAGDLDLALRRLLEAELLWMECGLRGPARWCGTGVALAAAGLGETATARAALARMAAYPAECFELFEPLQRLAGAWVAMAEHDQARARSLGAEASELARVRGAWAFASWIAHDLARLGLDDLAAVVVDALPGERSPLSAARVAYVRAGLARDPAAFDAVADGFEAMGAALFAAESHARAARLRRGAGQRRAALRNEGRTGALLESLPAASTPPLASRHGQGPLSPRERQVAELAAAGRSNRDIATLLVVSERTVENHLYRVFIKLGVGSRADLAGVLGAVDG